MTKNFNKEQIEEGVLSILNGLGLDMNNQHIKDTPKRVTESYIEMFAGLYIDAPKLKVFEEPYSDQMIISKDIPFFSFCSHHLLPYQGKAKIAYIPKNNKIVGLSKLARVLDYYTKRPSVQEIVTSSIADFLFEHKDLKPLGVGVILEASHDCEIIRGVKKTGSMMVTSALRGVFTKPEIRQEFQKL